MDAAQIPAKFPLIFGFDAATAQLTQPIPMPTQTGPNVGRASLTVGFPPITFNDPAAGGIWPDGRDVNGILYMLSAVAQWQQAGGQWIYDSAFQSSVGGYPVGSIVASAISQGRFWISTADNNTTNPDTGGAGWLQWGQTVITTFSAPGGYSYTVPPYCNQIYGECWGGGGGGSGGTGGAGGGGGYAAGYFSVVPGQVLNIVVGGAGGGASSGGTAGTGGNSTLVLGSTGLLVSTGGVGGSAGSGQGGIGTTGAILMQGGQGMDLDATLSFAMGGAAPRGGLGGIINAAGLGNGPTWPGGGGGANANVAGGQNGNVGGIIISARIGS